MIDQGRNEMKIRSDYVSNSSSSSFIIKKDAAKAAKMFLEDFGSCIYGAYDPLGETMNVGVRTNGMSSEDDWMDWFGPEKFCGDYIYGPYDGDTDTHADPKNPEDITEFGFECDDWDKAAMGNLAFLFKYFKKFGFEPDDSDSEHDFRDNDTFLGRILDRLEVKESANEDKK